MNQSGAPRVIDSLSRLASSSERPLDEATLRAYPLSRCLDYGCSIDDVLKLHTQVQAGASWVDTGSQLARDDLLRADSEFAADRQDNAAAYCFHAAACWRVTQSALEDTPEQRLQAYTQQTHAFRRAIDISGLDAQFHDIVFNGARHMAWLFRPGSAQAVRTPCVVIFGGADGWGEAFYSSVRCYVDRGLSVCLLELPGQGLARLRDGSLLSHGFSAMVSLTLDRLTELGMSAGRYGVIGHSMGGALALAAAAADERLIACCSNGGSVDLATAVSRFPRVLQRVARMTGETEDATVELIRDLDLPGAAQRMRARLLVLQGGKDVLVTDAEADKLVHLRGDRHATREYWPQGVHCVYNHSFERNCILGNWFADALFE